MERELSGEIIHPKDFSEVLAKLNIPIGRHDWWLIRWGIIFGLSLLSIFFFYMAFVSGKITLFQLLMGSLAFPLWMAVYVFFPTTIATVFNRLWNDGHSRLVLLFGLLTLFPAMLTVWLALPHREMKRARDVQLQPIVDEYSKTIRETRASMTEATAAIAEGTERLVALRKCYDQVRGSFSTWPVEISTASKIGLAVFLPLLTSLVPAVIYLVRKTAK